MSASLRPMTPDEFLEWEERQELKYEFDGVNIEAMVGGTAGHGTVQVNLAAVLATALDGQPCRFFNSDMKLKVGRSWRYPDGMVVCVPVKRLATFVTQPTVIFEVLSDSTSLKDMTVKNDEYQSIDAMRRYVMLEQDRVAATVFAREGDDWVGRRVVGPDATLDMPELGIAAVALSRLYRGIDFDEVDEPLN